MALRSDLAASHHLIEKAALGAIERNLGLKFAEKSRVEILCDGEQAYPAMLAAIEGARRRVILETYIYRHDRAGIRFFEALLERLRAGVEVYVLYDDFGGGEAVELFDELRGQGARICAVNPVSLFRPFHIMQKRDHRKILVVDGETGFTGGLNIGSEYLDENGPYLPFRDTHLKIEGPLVTQLERAFWEMWEYQTGVHHEPLARPPSEGDMRGFILSESYRRSSRSLRRLYQTAFQRAHRRIWITNSYFIPHAPLRRALIKAAHRGVDVRVIVPGPTDVPVVRWASRALYPVLLKSGIRIFEYTPRILHAKSVVIDQNWAMVGSTNLDHRSFTHNLEAQALILDEGLTEQLAAIFERDLLSSREITLADWQRLSRISKVFYRFFYLFREWL